MIRAARSIRLYLLPGAALVLAIPAVASHAAAQEVVPPPTPNADRLAEQMRILATDPRNVPALLEAGELSARLNDPAAAAG
ncbi:MAG: SPOR domain-containing protein, partial [Sphingomonas sp.]